MGDVEFAERAARSNLAPLWQQVTLHQLGVPQPPPSCLWAWSEVQPLITEAVEQTSTAKAERRVLLLKDPAARGIAVSPTMQGALQILMPGEEARPHRHTPNALRFVIEDGGDVSTIVDGKDCTMERGDLIITPAYTWHSHISRGPNRAVWLDVLDSALTDAFDAGFFEPGPVEIFPPTLSDTQFIAPGFGPEITQAQTYSPMFRYPWAVAQRALAALPLATDGTRVMRYTSVATGGSVMSHLDCSLLEVGTTPSRARRTTASALCLVARGCGSSSIGDQRVNWQENDIFTLPRWSWTSHRADSDGAILFVVSDQDVLSRLDLLRTEIQD
ncbi:cupin domain-containing protein [Novosphingobium sp.]|uniref:cupin domain-containing protein n=1 Tax=Novosphingobium sp. TaxID=1874826 RepID=UPI002FE15C7B